KNAKGPVPVMLIIGGQNPAAPGGLFGGLGAGGARAGAPAPGAGAAATPAGAVPADAARAGTPPAARGPVALQAPPRCDNAVANAYWATHDAPPPAAPRAGGAGFGPGAGGTPPPPCSGQSACAQLIARGW